MADKPKRAPAKARKSRFGWDKGDVTWVVTPEQAAAKLKKKPPAKP